MDIEFLKLTAKSYCSDRQLNIREEVVFNEIYEAIQYFRFCCPTVYKKAYNRSHGFHQKAIYEYLDFRYALNLIDECEITEATNPLAAFSQILNRRKKQTSNTIKYDRMVELLNAPDQTCVYRCADNQRRHIGITKNGNNQESESYRDCIYFCSLDRLIELYVDASMAYNRCIENLNSEEVGGSQQITKFNDIIRSYPLDLNCEAIHNQALQFYNNIQELIGFISDPRIRAEWVRYINLKLDAAKRGQTITMDYTKLTSSSIEPIRNIHMGS